VKLGIKSLSLSASKQSLNKTMQNVRQSAEKKGLSLKWDLPVPYSSFNPVALELSGNTAPGKGAGKAWLYVEPDGDVLAAQGMPAVLGNLLNDTWEDIWAKTPD